MKLLTIIMLTVSCILFAIAEKSEACSAELYCYCNNWGKETYAGKLSVNGHQYTSLASAYHCLPNIHQIKQGARLCLERKCNSYSDSSATAKDKKDYECTYYSDKTYGSCFAD